MSITLRRTCLSLVLMIAISHVALAIHASGHAGADVITCQLCVCQGQQSHGIGPSVTQLPVVTNHYLCAGPLPVIQPRPALRLAYYQRAPPAIV